MGRKKWQTGIEQFTKQMAGKGLLAVLLAAVLTGSGCGRAREQEKPQETLDPVEIDQSEDLEKEGEQPALDQKPGDSEKEPEDSSEEDSSQEEGDPAGDSEAEKDSDLEYAGDGEDQEEEGVVIERVGEPVSYEAEDGTQLFISGLYYPFVSIPENPAAAEKINQVFETQKKEDEVQIAEYKEWAEEAYQEQQEQAENTFLNYALDRDYIVTSSGERLLCINEVEYSYAGGNFDLATGDLVGWEQMTDDVEGFRSFLAEQIHTFLETEQMTDGMTWSEALYPNYQDTLPLLLETPNWYVEEGNLNIVFNPYDIAPYAAGSIAVNVPLADCEEYWNAYGREILQPGDNY